MNDNPEIKKVSNKNPENLRDVFWQKLDYSSKSKLFKIYFFGVIIFYSGLSVLFPIIYALYYQKTENIISIFQSLTTYAIVITGTAFADLIITMDDDNDSKKPKSVSAKFSHLCMLVICFVVILLTIWTYFEISWFISIPLVILGAALAILTWWIANADNTKLADDDTNANNATGGDVEIISGSATGITLS